MSALTLAGVSGGYRGAAAVSAIDLTVGRGEVVALVGLNGTGKTTLLRLAFGMVRPTAGRVSVLGTPVAGLPAAIWGRVGYLVDTPLAYPELTVRENLRMALSLHGRSAARLDQCLGRWRLRESAGRRLRHLSLGNRQRVGLAAALAHDPDLVVLDEPGNALDPAGVIILRDELRRRADAGAGVLVSSHHLDEVARVADRVLVMNAGRLVGALDPHGAELERAFFAMVRADDEERVR
ncbi:ABC transporter ATP-binding protein [Propioniciclava coleopterorum]|uniref:ABC transporter ATP-binding protein n=1 Tax=Propioniciclava coleopterorum TaxID=2714937 RepID=A0A6G7Y4L3_9ACTN|nr:ABC transporter ATP-binding protein [Propioniciclava coleopterorum]QIK71649.1 ABC transporter ATP-binding protein [Propioniciclava coleopterorum]